MLITALLTRDRGPFIANATRELGELTGTPDEDCPVSKVDSLDKALELAMRTIAMASETESGSATELLPLASDRSEMPVPDCAVKLSKLVPDKNYCEYKGWYHTDHTLPSEYFLPVVGRPAEIKAHSLDFTYLFHQVIDNPDFRLMGEGLQIRDLTINGEELLSVRNLYGLGLKRRMGREEEVLIGTQERLIRILGA
jgi:hypothetical protein